MGCSVLADRRLYSEVFLRKQEQSDNEKESRPLGRDHNSQFFSSPAMTISTKRGCIWKTSSRMTALLMASHIVCLAAQEPGSTKGATTPEPGSSGRDWYRPAPRSPNFNGTFALAPVTVDRPVVAIPLAVRNLAISELTDAEVMKLTREDCRTLGVPFEADELLDNVINEKARDVKQGFRYMKLHPLDGSSSDATYMSIKRGIAENKAQIGHWKSLKGRVRPYLVRAVAANDVNHEFYATFWRDSVTVVHRSVVHNSANDPLRQHASIGDMEPAEMVKWPVVVYIEAPPAHIYTRIHVLKLGR
jgi:hypothetical protein